ncbi:prohead protease [Nitrososphaeria virus YSH_922147]|uniref:Prohead protease n=1 Tax=Nitrososphaeria virus YSH_922147 TaxID=3071323 RepID=A0A976UBH7_9CAUD|nr:prohead protease [Yangshan Harbor Nitrososphaeria virus]UVF62435.1 prohead protease [Nitrososphaeria virus YSH_922147]
MSKVIIESHLVKFKEGKISGTALIPYFSLNGNGYTPEILEANDGACVPIDWNHDRREGAGNVCFKYNKETQRLTYEGTVTDPEILSEIKKNPNMHVSIEGDVYQVDKHCNSKTCYHIPLEMKIVRMAITPTPGVPETSLTLAESVKIIGEESELDEIKERLSKIESLICPDCGKFSS